MTNKNSFLRVCLAIACILGAVPWAIAGLLLLAAALRGQGMFGQHGSLGTIVLIVLWVGGLLALVGGAVAMLRPSLQNLTSQIEKDRSKKRKD